MVLFVIVVFNVWHKMKRVLVTGHTGMLGRKVVEYLVLEGKYEVFGISKTKRLNGVSVNQYHVDLTDEVLVKDLLLKISPDVIIHTAALTKLQYCEVNITEAYKLHVNLTRTLAEFTKAKFYYISTDSVFNGEKGNYSENYPTYPLNYYAQSKLQGEWVAMSANPNTLVLRTNIYGFKNPAGSSLAEWALRSLREGKPLSGYTDVLFNPLYVGQLSELIITCIDRQVKGVLNVGTFEYVSKFDFLKTLTRVMGYSESMVMESIAPNESNLRRPKDTTLSVQRMKEDLNKEASLIVGLNMFKRDYLQSSESN